jgi:hypothetical protein
VIYSLWRIGDIQLWKVWGLLAPIGDLIKMPRIMRQGCELGRLGKRKAPDTGGCRGFGFRLGGTIDGGGNPAGE